MPVVLKIDPQRRVVYSTFYGTITDAELLRHGQTIAADPDFDPEFNEIVDFSGVSMPNISERTLTALADNPSLYGEASLHIIVAPEQLSLELVHKFVAIAQGKRRNLFVVRSRADAYKLLEG
jgi:hypothetical protein